MRAQKTPFRTNSFVAHPFIIMAVITNEQMRFFEKHFIPLSKVFDASGLTASQWKSEMKALGMEVAIGVNPCSKASHTMRTHSGHCLQCGTHNLAFLRRYEDAGSVYIAVSKSSSLLKVGTATDATMRIQTLNSHGYGGVDDWRLSYEQPCDKAGRVEFEAQKILRSYRANDINYQKQGMTVSCQELFSCNLSCAIQAISTALNFLGVSNRKKIPGLQSIGLFRFNPLVLSSRLTYKNDCLSGGPKKKCMSSGSDETSNVQYLPCKASKFERKNSIAENVITIKGRIEVAKLASLMKVNVKVLIQDLRRLATYAKRDSILNRNVAITLCGLHGFKFRYNGRSRQSK